MEARHFFRTIALLWIAGFGMVSKGDEASVGAKAFVNSLAQRAFLSGTGDSGSVAVRQKRLGGFLDQDFDVPEIAAFVLGHYWQRASESDRAKFLLAYRDYLIRVYTMKLTGYAGERFHIVEATVGTDASIVVYTVMSKSDSDQPLDVSWRVVDKGGFHVVDLGIAGISMAQVQRDDFQSILRQNGGDVASLSSKLQGISVAQGTR